MEKTLRRHLKSYLKSRRNAWADTTLKTAASKLSLLLPLLDGNAERLWTRLEAAYAPYARTQYWALVIGFYDYLLREKIKRGRNPYADFRTTNRRLFKNVYVRRPAELSYQEVARLVQSISDNDTREAVLFILGNGLRISEYRSTDGATVVGKGSKERSLFGPKPPRVRVSVHRIRRALREVGLRPHDLRKAFATELDRRGIDAVDFCKVMGWESIETAMSYVSPRKEEELRQIVKEAVG